MGEFRVGDCTYRVNPNRRMNCFVQSDVMAAIAPLVFSGFAELAPIMMTFREGGLAAIQDTPLKRLATIGMPVSREIAKMDSEGRMAIYSACLSTLDRQKDGEPGWAPVWNAQGRRPMFDDLYYDATALIQVVAGVLNETFASFLAAHLSRLTAGG